MKICYNDLGIYDSGKNRFNPDTLEAALMKINNIPAKEFRIVRPHYNSSFLTEVQIEALKKICYGKDARETVDDVGEAPAKYEIVVGNTNRSGSLAIDDYDSFSVRIEGDKVYLNGGSPYATAAAVKSFAKLLKSHSVTDADSFCGSYKEYEKTVDRKLEYTPRWIDDFDGDSVDTSKWYLINEEYTGKGPDGLSGKNGKRAFRSSSPDVTYIKNGCFNVNFSQDEHNYYGGTLRAYEKLQFKYGYMETSAKLPKGSGFWNTLWLSSIQKGLRILPEIDVNESFGSAAEVRANVHIWPNAKLKEEGHAHHSFDDLKQGAGRLHAPIQSCSAMIFTPSVCFGPITAFLSQATAGYTARLILQLTRTLLKRSPQPKCIRS